MLVSTCPSHSIPGMEIQAILSTLARDIHPQFHANPACLQLSHPNTERGDAKWSLCDKSRRRRVVVAAGRRPTRNCERCAREFLSWNVHNAKEITVGNGNVTFLLDIKCTHTTTPTPSSSHSESSNSSSGEEVNSSRDKHTCWAFRSARS